MFVDLILENIKETEALKRKKRLKVRAYKGIKNSHACSFLRDMPFAKKNPGFVP